MQPGTSGEKQEQIVREELAEHTDGAIVLYQAADGSTGREAVAAFFAATAAEVAERESRDQGAKGKETEDAVDDLKAVNPHRRPGVDERTPEALLAPVAAKGLEIAAVLAGLRVTGTGLKRR